LDPLQAKSPNQAFQMRQADTDVRGSLVDFHHVIRWSDKYASIGEPHATVGYYLCTLLPKWAPVSHFTSEPADNRSLRSITHRMPFVHLRPCVHSQHRVLITRH